MNVSMRLASLTDRYGATSKPFTSPAIWQARRAGSNFVMRVIPDLPARAFCQASATVLPMGQTMPRPVTATLRRDTSLLGVIFDVVDGLLDGGDFLRLFVGDLGLELLLERHHQLHRVERVGTEVVDERGLDLDLALVDAELLGDDFLDALFYVFHRHPSRFMGPRGAVFYDIYMPPLTCRTVPVT